MGKEKKEIKFNPADYDYMNNMPLEGWFWEIIRRSQDYMASYKKLEEANSTDFEKCLIDFINETKVFPNYMFFKGDAERRKKEIKSKCLKKYKHFALYSTVTTRTHFRHKRIEQEFTVLALPVPTTKYCDFSVEFTPKIWGCSPMIYSLNDKRLRFITDTMPVNNMFSIILPNTFSSSDISKVLIPLIKNYIGPRVRRIRDDKWKDYIMVHDLKKQHITYNEIADIMLKIFPEKQRLFDERNIENYYKNSLELINGGYKKYI